MDMSAQTPMSASSRQNTHESIQLCRKPNNSAEVSLKNAGDSLRTFFGEGQAYTVVEGRGEEKWSDWSHFHTSKSEFWIDIVFEMIRLM